MLVELKAAYAVTLLLQLKLYIKTIYRLDSDRIANFSPSGKLSECSILGSAYIVLKFTRQSHILFCRREKEE